MHNDTSTERETVAAPTHEGARAQLLALIKTHGILDITELLAECCTTAANDSETDLADADYLRAAQFHLHEAASILQGC